MVFLEIIYERKIKAKIIQKKKKKKKKKNKKKKKKKREKETKEILKPYRNQQITSLLLSFVLNEYKNQHQHQLLWHLWHHRNKESVEERSFIKMLKNLEPYNLPQLILYGLLK